MPLPDRLKTARLRAGLTQRQLAAKIGFHKMSISQLERGARSPSMATLARLAKALRTTPSALVR
jgi:transcriptional regulator with XRE-family HTH domain